MIEISNGCYIIGFDNGYQFGKTASTLFDNGVYAMGKVEPSISIIRLERAELRSQRIRYLMKMQGCLQWLLLRKNLVQ